MKGMRNRVVGVMVGVSSLVFVVGFSSHSAASADPPPTTEPIPVPVTTPPGGGGGGSGGSPTDGPCAYEEFNSNAGQMNLSTVYDGRIPVDLQWHWVKTNYPAGTTSKAIDTTVMVDGAQYPVSDAAHQNDSPSTDEHGTLTSPWTDTNGQSHVLLPGQVVTVSIEATFYPSLSSVTMEGQCDL